MKLRRRFLWRRDGSLPTELEVETLRDGTVHLRDGGRETLADCAALPDGRRSVILPSGRQVTGRAVAGRDGHIEAWIRGRR
ncbi:MAG TPA: hypothetical protein VGK86_10085, partial [Thermoanaerobaculia bacterium]